jgi:hypothetical protein
VSDFQVTLNQTNYTVLPQEPDQYNVGVDYAPANKSIQYQNLLLDNISGQFDCIRKTFDLRVGGSLYNALNDQQLIISLNNTILQPGIGYTVSGNQITFATAPCNVPFFGIALANTADLTRTINYVVDSGSLAVAHGDKGCLTIDVTGVIESWVIVADKVGSLIVDVKKSSFNNYPNLVSICGSSRPSLVNQNKNTDSTLSGWNKTLNAGDVINYEVISASNINKFSISFKVKL